MGDDKPYFTIAALAECEALIFKGSRFIGFAAPASSDTAALAQVAVIKARFPDARHWCWAYQLREQRKTRFADDGEPKGSAGKPILAPIVGRELVDTVVIVVRYFGGVKLGVGGLVRAYSQAANAALEVAEVLTITPTIALKLHYDYGDTAAVAAALADLNLHEESPDYSDRVVATLRVPPKAVDTVIERLTDCTSGRAKCKRK